MVQLKSDDCVGAEPQQGQQCLAVCRVLLFTHSHLLEGSLTKRSPQSALWGFKEIHLLSVKGTKSWPPIPLC